jgi:hypothetical protein
MLTEQARRNAARDAPTLGEMTYSYERSYRITLTNELDVCSIVRFMTP